MTSDTLSLKKFLSYRSSRFAIGFITLLSLVCTQVPLFNYLGFEFSALIALFGSFIVGLLTIVLWKNVAEEYAGHLWKFSFHIVLLFLLLLLVPFLIISANALFVKNCSFVHGVALFVLIPAPSFIFAYAIALLVSISISGWRKTVFVSVCFIILLHIAYVTFTRPQIFTFNPLIGYFPGFTYDEGLRVINRLLIYRLGSLAASIAIIMLAVIIHRRKESKNVSTETEAPSKFFANSWEPALLCLLIAGVVGIYSASDRLGLSSSESYIRQQAFAEVDMGHVIVVLPDSSLKGKRLEQILQLHEFYFAQLSRAFRIDPQRKIYSFLYSSPEQKARLIGAGGTNIAKPWLWQLHLNIADVEGSLKHELAHVMAAEFGFPFIRVGLNSGLIEGLATAAERTAYDESLHRLSAMIFDIGANPDMESLFSLSGFMKAHPGVSYSLAGSFCRFLIDRYGIRRFKMLYQTGSFSSFYNKNLPALLKEWESFLRGYTLNDADREKAAYLFKRPSIFGKECARVIANLNEETRALYGQKQYQSALESAERSLKHSTSVEAIFQKTNSLFRLRRFKEAIEYGNSKLNDETVAHSLLPLKLIMGDAYWAEDSLVAAKRMYQELSLTRLSASWDEASTIRLEIFLDPSLGLKLRPYFVQDMPDSTKIALLEGIVQENPKSAIAKYLLGRELAFQEKNEEAIKILEDIPRMRFDALQYHQQRRIAQMYFLLGKYQKAKIYFWQAINYTAGEAQDLRLEERLNLCDWMEEKTEGSK